MNNKTKRLVTCGVLLGASFVLSFIKIPWLPFGGSVTLFSMVPVIMAGILFGVKWGMLTSCSYALLQLFQSIASSKSFVLDTAWQTILMILLDFVLAFAFLGLGGIFVKRKRSDKYVAAHGAWGALTVTLIRYAMHTISGFILYGSFAEWYFGEEFTNKLGTWALSTLSGAKLAWFYSFVYNGLYMIPEIIITVAAVLILLKIPRIKRRFLS